MTPENYECRACHTGMYVPDGMEPLDEDVRLCHSCAIDEIERLREYRDHHEFVLSQIEALTRVKISTIDDVLAEIKGLNAVVAKLTRDCNSLEDDVRYNGEALARSDEMKGEIDRLQAIVDRLEKTQDGVPIVNDLEVFDLPESHGLQCAGLLRGIVRQRPAYIEVQSEHNPHLREMQYARQMFSTREAAEKARKE